MAESTDDLTERLAKTLTEHEISEPRGYAFIVCSCGSEFGNERTAREHVAAALLSIVAEREAAAEQRGAERAWEEGAITALDYATRDEDGIGLSLDLTAHSNPYRADAR